MTDKLLKFTSGFSVKSVDGEDSITIEGYANTTTKDRMGDVILEEAWSKGGLDNYLKNPILLAYHNHQKPIGIMVDYGVNNQGLKIVAEISKAAGEVYDLIKSEILKTFSVGFRVKDADYDEATNLFVIKDLELYEISVVAVPANADSTFSIRKCLKDEEYKDFKEEYNHMSEEKKVESTETIVKTTESETNTDKLEKALEEKFEKSIETITGNFEAALELALESKKENEKVTEKVEVGDSGAEKLIKELTARLEKSEASTEEALTGLRTELKDKAEEIEAIHKSKMTFGREETVKISERDIDTAVLVSKATGIPLEKTKFGKDLIEKSGAQHVPGAADSSDWEKEFARRIFNDVRDKLVLEPLFPTIDMPTYALQIPINPEAGTATWIATAAFRSTDKTSTGSAQDHAVTDTTLTAHKLASKEYIGYEEEEDAIIPIVPIIRDAVVRRMARSSDIALLRGDSGQSSGSGLWPFNGVATLAADTGGVYQTEVAVGDTVTVDNLQTVRRGLGARGLNPGDVKYIVSEDVYYDLLEDDDFRTMDMVGDRATILKGQIGFVNGSSVIVSDSYEAKAATKHAAVAVYTPNFVVGNLRGMMVERDRDIENQKNIIVATRRMGFLGLISGKGTSVLTWKA